MGSNIICDLLKQVTVQSEGLYQAPTNFLMWLVTFFVGEVFENMPGPQILTFQVWSPGATETLHRTATQHRSCYKMRSSEGATPSVLMAPCSTSVAGTMRNSCRSPPCSRAGSGWQVKMTDSPEGVGHRKSLTWFVMFHLMVAIFRPSEGRRVRCCCFLFRIISLNPKAPDFCEFCECFLETACC